MARRKNIEEQLVVAKCGHKFEQTPFLAICVYRAWRHYGRSNIYKSEELEEMATCAIIAQVRNEGGREVKRTCKYYNLDMILSVGYRVNSRNATYFRKWASAILKDYLLRGYAINPRLEQLEKRVATPPNRVRMPQKTHGWTPKQPLRCQSGAKRVCSVYPAACRRPVVFPSEISSGLRPPTSLSSRRGPCKQRMASGHFVP